MTRKTTHLGGHAFQAVFGFTIRYWRKQPARTATVAGFALLAALADVLTPLFAGRLSPTQQQRMHANFTCHNIYHPILLENEVALQTAGIASRVHDHTSSATSVQSHTKE